MILKVLASRYLGIAALVTGVLLVLKSPWPEEDGYELRALEQSPSAVTAATTSNLREEASVSREAEEGNLSLKSSALSPEGFLTDTVLMGWLVSWGLIWLMRKLFREPTLLPSRRQVAVEFIIDGLKGLLEPIVGKAALSYAFPALLAYFFFILFHNWSGFFPGVSSIGLQEGGRFLPFLRPMNSDLNATLGIALVSMVVWSYCVAKCAGLQGFCEETFGNKAERAGIPFFIYHALTFIFLAVGCIECISILFRPVSLSFRLFGNVFGGETLLHHMYGFGEFLSSGGFGQTSLYALLAKISSGMADGINLFLSWAGYFLPLPFYFLEGLIGLIQAFVFTLLVAVYIGLICHHEEEVPTNSAMGVQS